MSNYDVTVTSPAGYAVTEQQDVTQYTITASFQEGPSGLSLLTGHGAPTAAVGQPGETYIDIDTYTFYGPKANGAWPDGVPLLGAAATVAVGPTTTGVAGSAADVTNTGTPNAAVLAFTVPQGTPGADGKVQSIVAGTNVTVDASDPANPKVSASGTPGALVAADNLSDVPNPLTARQNLGAASRSAAIFDVRDYGAKGDGTTDDTAAVTAAVTAMKTAKGGVLYFPAGVYKITTFPVFNPEVDGLGDGETWLPYAVRGDGSRNTVLLSYATTLADSLGVTDPTASNAVGCARWGGFTIDGQNATGTAVGLHLGDMSGLTFEDVSVNNFTTSDGWYWHNRYSWTEKVHLIGCSAGFCKNCWHFYVESGIPGSFMYWTVEDQEFYPAANGNMILDADGDQSTHNFGSFRMTANCAKVTGNTGVLFNLPNNNQWWGCHMEFMCESYGDGDPHKSISMTTAAMWVTEGTLVFYYMGAPTIPTPVAWYFQHSGTLGVAGLVDPQGSDLIHSAAFTHRIMDSQPALGTASDNYPATITSNTAFQNTTGSDLLVTVILEGVAYFSGNQSTAPTGQGAQVCMLTGGVPFTFVHYAGAWVMFNSSYGMSVAMVNGI